MSLGNVLANALSGLRVATAAADVISNNVSNAHNEDYTKQNLAVESNEFGGARVTGVQRNLDVFLQANLRDAEARFANHKQLQQFHQKLGQLLGVGNADHALTQRFSAFEKSLIEASSRADIPARLEAVVNTAKDLTKFINATAKGILQERSDADRRIDLDVKDINAGLKSIAQLNVEITKLTSKGENVSNLLDARDRIIDDISEKIPLRVENRRRNQVALFSEGGINLLDGRPAQLQLEVVRDENAPTNVSDGTRQLTVNGHMIDFKEVNALGGGSLAANFRIRDELSVAAEDRLNHLSADLITRFSDSTMDSSLAEGAPGLFTNGGDALDPNNLTALSLKIAVNAAVDHKQGGASWRIRDGIGATEPGPVNENALILRMKNALSQASSSDKASLLQQANEFSDIALSDMVASEGGLSFAQSVRDAFHTEKNRYGVDSDAEMQSLLLVEKLYSANAKIIQAVDEMLETLIRM